MISVSVREEETFTHLKTKARRPGGHKDCKLQILRGLLRLWLWFRGVHRVVGGGGLGVTGMDR